MTVVVSVRAVNRGGTKLARVAEINPKSGDEIRAVVLEDWEERNFTLHDGASLSISEVPRPAPDAAPAA